MILIHRIAISSLALGIFCALVILMDILAGHRQHMRVMNFVYPITALFAGPLAWVVYFTVGRRTAHGPMKGPMNSTKKPFWQSVIVSTLHCGSGCTLGDLLSETLLLAFPLSLFGSLLYGAWLIDFLFAFLFGIVFQYYSIKPMKKLSHQKALAAALKADTLSLIAWQVGMYGGMAIATFAIFFSPASRSYRVAVLVCDAGCHADGVCYCVSSKLVAVEERH